MPAGSKMDPPLAKAKPISASVITYLRRKKKQRELLQLERGVRRCERNNSADTKSHLAKSINLAFRILFFEDENSNYPDGLTGLDLSPPQAGTPLC
ncbi:zinc finger protein 462-like [Grus japonensis]|uniref:Zinc finger protein 462-like n=1 Tax=Grus japonensis TaxID=30415 RepID=A0ABC9WCB4_GRUJA